MTNKVYVVTDLGPGDGGKGGVVHKIATTMKAHTVIKRGGAQGSHGVQTSLGESFAFSQWGCGTLNYIPTHISRQMIVHPEGLINEANALRYQMGIYDPFDLLTIDEQALCATPFHGIASHLIELSFGKNPRGTVGTGVGVAYRSYRKHPEMSIMAGNLLDRNLKERLYFVRESLKAELKSIIEGEFLEEDRPTHDREVNLLYDDKFLEHVTNCFTQVGKMAKIVGSDYLGEVILKKDGVAVVEPSHGVLTDRVMGFSPHTSAIRTLPCFVDQLLRESGFCGQIVNIGVTRAYAIRHGAGPLPTADPEMVKNLLPGSHKLENRWQGAVRVGPLDFVLLRYAVEICGGVTKFDGIALSCFDQVIKNGDWKICQRYKDEGENITVCHNSDEIDQLAYQTELTKKLFGCIPELNSIKLDPNLDQEKLFQLSNSLFYQSVGIPVRMVSFGPTELDKFLK